MERGEKEITSNWQAPARKGSAWMRKARHARAQLCFPRRRSARHGWARQPLAMLGMVLQGKARHGGYETYNPQRNIQTGHGSAVRRVERRGSAGLSVARRSKARLRSDRLGYAIPGAASRCGAKHSEARPGRARQSVERHRWASQGTTWTGSAGRGMVGRGAGRQRTAWKGLVMIPLAPPDRIGRLSSMRRLGHRISGT